MWSLSWQRTGRSIWGPPASLPPASLSLLEFIMHAFPPYWGFQLEFDLKSFHFEFIIQAGPLASGL